MTRRLRPEEELPPATLEAVEELIAAAKRPAGAAELRDFLTNIQHAYVDWLDGEYVCYHAAVAAHCTGEA